MELSVSLLIPTYNRCHLISRAIDSCLNQTFVCEVIVCDHGSTDKTHDICIGYGDKINYIRRDKDYGLHFCEMEALLSAKNNLIHFCFDDDWMHPQYIEYSIKFFNERIGMVYCEHELINLNKDLKNLKKWTLPSNYEVKRLNTFTGLPKVMKGLISPSCALLRKSDAIKCMYLTNNLISKNSYEGVGPDWLMTAFPIFEYPNCIFIKAPLVRFGDHDDSITIDAQKEFYSNKAKKFRAAYTGARLYLLVGIMIKKLNVETFYIFLEECFRKIKITFKRN